MTEYKVIQDTSMHRFKIGSIITRTDNPVVLDDGGKEYTDGKEERMVHDEDVRVYVQSWPVRLYRAIVGALFGPESHSKERYSQK